MNGIVDLVNTAVHWIVSLFLKPFSGLNPLWGLTAVSVLLGVILVVAYGKLSRQESIRKVKSEIYRALLESVLFRHDIRLSLKAQGAMLLRAVKYFALAVPPLLILAVPCIIVLAQLNQWYEDRPLRVGEAGIVKVELKSQTDVTSVNFTSPDTLAVTSVRVPADKELFLRVTPLTAGNHDIVFSLSGEEFRMPIMSGEYAGPLLLGSYGDWWRRILTPDGPIKSAAAALSGVEVHYPSRDLVVGGMRTSWLVFFFIVSFIAGLVGAKIFRIAV